MKIMEWVQVGVGACQSGRKKVTLVNGIKGEEGIEIENGFAQQCGLSMQMQ